MGYNYCYPDVISYCYKCYCDKQNSVTCAEPDFPGTMGNIKMSVSVYVSLSTQEKILDISKVGWESRAKAGSPTTAPYWQRSGKLYQQL